MTALHNASVSTIFSISVGAGQFTFQNTVDMIAIMDEQQQGLFA